MKDQLAPAGSGVDRLGDALEGNAQSFELLDRLDQVLEGAAKPVQTPNNESIAGTQRFEQAR